MEKTIHNDTILPKTDTLTREIVPEDQQLRQYNPYFIKITQITALISP